MPQIGITGHARLDGATPELVFDALVDTLREHADPAPRGVTCLAYGADQIFARAVLALRGTFDVVLPARDYRARLSRGHRGPFDELLARAGDVVTMPFARSSRQAYLAASLHMLQRVDLLVAVWDGRPSRNLGDTADVVCTAQRAGVPVLVRWPSGASRTAARRTCRQDSYP
ncbi:MAG TPA: hypothetical protein VJT31_24665 [Rugosimonospora sp.]|nr:hypothetical protein [Rugosimonospora sp.]